MKQIDEISEKMNFHPTDKIKAPIREEIIGRMASFYGVSENDKTKKEKVK